MHRSADFCETANATNRYNQWNCERNNLLAQITEFIEKQSTFADVAKTYRK